ncbi:MAG: DUF5615 family PIN-like protein [Haliscomenobacter sp.]|nr:DUF5615 family PIN-like protein [Haliscomenobacter sp.]
MNFLADEGVDRQIVIRLRAEGHHVLYVAETAAGADDDTVLKMASMENRILITRDKDFGELAFRSRRAHTGIILNRLHELPSDTKADLVAQVINNFKEQLIGAFTVIQPGRVRIKKI